MKRQLESKRSSIRDRRAAAGIALLCIAGLAHVAPVSAADGDAVVSLRGLSKALRMSPPRCPPRW